MTFGREPSSHDAAAGEPHPLLQLSVGQQLVQGAGKGRDISRPDGETIDAIFEPLSDPSRRAANHRRAGGQGLDANQPEGLGPQRGHRKERGAGELLCELLLLKPTLEMNPLLQAQTPREPTHRVELPSIATDNEFTRHKASGAKQHGDPLGGHHAARVNDAPTLDGVRARVRRARRCLHRAEQRDHRVSGDPVRGEMALHGS